MPLVYQHRGGSFCRTGWWCTGGMATTLNKLTEGSRAKAEAAAAAERNEVSTERVSATAVIVLRE